MRLQTYSRANYLQSYHYSGGTASETREGVGSCGAKRPTSAQRTNQKSKMRIHPSRTCGLRRLVDYEGGYPCHPRTNDEEPGATGSILLLGLLVVRAPIIILLLSIGARCARRQRRNGRNHSRLNIDPAAITIDNGCGATWAHHDGIADVAINAVVYWLEALALIDRKSALSWLNRCGPSRAAQEQGASKGQSTRVRRLAHHHAPHCRVGYAFLA